MTDNLAASTSVTTHDNDTDKVKITFKVSGGSQFSLEISPSLTVLEVKQLGEKHCDVAPAHQRLIYRGRILKDHEKLSDHSVADGHIMHLVKSGGAVAPSQPTAAAAPQPSPSLGSIGSANPTTSIPPVNAPSPTTGLPAGAQQASMDPFLSSFLTGGFGGNAPFGGTGSGVGGQGTGGFGPMGIDPTQLQDMMDNTMGQQIVQELLNNPEMMRTMLQSNPVAQQAMQQYPFLRGMLDNPEMLRNVLSGDALRASLNMQGNAGGAANTSATPLNAAFGAQPGQIPATATGGVPTNTGYSGTTPGEQPPTNSMAEIMRLSMQMMERNPELMRTVMQQGFGGGLGGMAGGPLAGMAGMAGGPLGGMAGGGVGGMAGGAFGGFPGGPATPNADSRPVAERFRTQLERLEEMGFIDRDANIQALTEANGNVDTAITILLDRGIGN